MSSDQPLEDVFIAGNVEEVRRVEQLLTTEGIEYSVRPQPLFEVLPGHAPYCRKLFTANGLEDGVVLPDAE